MYESPSNVSLKVRKCILGNAGKVRTRATLLAAALGLAVTVVASPPAPKTGNLAGKVSVKHWFQIGRASWYGRKFQGHKTASGEPFNMDALTCAHRSLPLGSWVKVTNLRNSKSVFLRVNDRGPVPRQRILDMSYAAAQKLDIHGVGDVRIEKVSANDPKVAEQLVASLPLSDNLPMAIR